MLTQFMLVNLLKHHEINADQKIAIAVLRERALRFAEAIIVYTKPGADQSAAIRHIREALWTVNSSVALNGLEGVPPPIEPKID